VPKENVMPAKLSPDVIRLIDGRNFAHLATVLPDGSPHSAPVWIGREGDRLFIATDDNSCPSSEFRALIKSRTWSAARQRWFR
jgi:hypothetical protein